MHSQEFLPLRFLEQMIAFTMSKIRFFMLAIFMIAAKIKFDFLSSELLISSLIVFRLMKILITQFVIVVI